MYSHSTMYLLKRNALGNTPATINLFTFHHVSIKTETQGDISKNANYSHSTMYLLKPQCVTNLIGGNLNSHSTMYLLKL